MKKICLLIPCYNEEATVAKVVSDFRRCLPEMEIYVYDNNSTDGTAREALGAGARVVAEPAQGKGNVVRSMFRDIDADAYVMVDGDDTYPAEALMRVLQPVLDGRADMVIGDRLSNGSYERENRRNFHSLGNNLVRSAVNRFFGTSLSDIMTGYRAFSYQFVKSFPVLSKGFEIETEMTIHALDKNLSVRSVQVEYRDRPADSPSKLNTYSDGMKVLRTIVRLYKEYRPMSFFGLLAALMALVSVILFIPIFAEYLHTGLVPRFPTLIVCGVMGTMALLLWVCGLILDTVAKKHRQLFEINLNLLNGQRRRERV